MRFLRRLILIAALAAGAAWLKQYLEEEGQAPWQEASDRGTSSGPSQGASSSSANGGSASNGSASGATKAELYERAQKLGIEGRSKMSKAELERAIRAAE